jgi:hypothetical protein
MSEGQRTGFVNQCGQASQKGSRTTLKVLFEVSAQEEAVPGWESGPVPSCIHVLVHTRDAESERQGNLMTDVI